MGRSLRLLMQGTPDSARIALLDETRLLEFYQEDTGAQSLVGSVFLGRVERVLPDVKAAFVKLGLRQNGFLPLREAESYHRTSGSASLMTGQDVLVQVKKDPKGEKGAFLTRDIGLPGQYVLLMPRNRFVGLSRRVTGEEDRARAQALGRRIADGRFGLIVRHAALFAPVAEVEAEAEALWESWRETEERARYCKAPALLHEEPSMLTVLLRDYAARHPIEVLSRLEPPEALPQGVTWQTLTAVEMEAAWSAARVEKQVDEALCRRVPLPGGGSLIIDEREALTTIDVNSGSTVTAADGETLAVEENLRAAAEAARQIRLRNLSGILLIDFIDMHSDMDRARVIAAMEEAAADDRVKTVIHGFTSLGLLEMTRKRTRDTLCDTLTQPCDACHGTGRVRRD